MKFDIITIFPKIFDSYFSESIIRRARDKKLVDIGVHNLRDWTEDKHKTIDDTPYGGGAGMVMKIEPLYLAIKSIKSQLSDSAPIKKIFAPLSSLVNKIFRLNKNTRIVLLSAKGKRWNQQKALEYSKLKNVVLICGRYEGVDERITEFIDEEISIGDFVLTGGEIGAMTIVDSVTRLLPGVLGNTESAKDESHSEPGVLEYPQYTKPKVFEADGKKLEVPEVLLTGNHKKIEEWREKNKKTIQ